MTSPLNDRQQQALTALRAMGGRATVLQMVEAGHLAVDPAKVDGYGRQTDRIGWGRTLSSLDARGLVHGVPTLINAPSSKMWALPS